MSEVEIIVVEIDPISALYYRFHTISILQVRKLVVQVTSTSRKTCNTSYKYKYNLQVGKNRPLGKVITLKIFKHSFETNISKYCRAQVQYVLWGYLGHWSLLTLKSGTFCKWHKIVYHYPNIIQFAETNKFFEKHIICPLLCSVSSIRFRPLLCSLRHGQSG